MGLFRPKISSSGGEEKKQIFQQTDIKTPINYKYILEDKTM